MDNYGATFALETGLMAGALLQGVIVTFSDHEGPNNAYAAGPQEGRAVLDSIRATINFGEIIGLLPTAKSVVWGYRYASASPCGFAAPYRKMHSGGATASSWAEALQKTYAPEVNLVGGAHGGTPADLEVTGLFLVSGTILIALPQANSALQNATPRSGFLISSLIGLANAFPDFAKSFYGNATPLMLALIKDAVDNQCGGKTRPIPTVVTLLTRRNFR